MRVAVLADIHANLAALNAVLAEVRREGIAQLVLLGDLVGYYYEPRAVIAALSAFDCTAIRGNHDRMALEARRDPSLLKAYWSKYGSGLEAVFEQFTAPEWDWLAALPETRAVNLGEWSIRLAHGATFDPDAYIYPDAPPELLSELVAGIGADHVWLGHTHWPFMRSGAPSILNPGSVGQPRDIGGLASWAIFHVETGAVAFRRSEFPTDALAAECRRRDPRRTALSDVLVRGRLGAAA